LKNIAVLKNPVQAYAWGSKTFIPELLGKPSPTKKPEAELWMGAHSKASSEVRRNGDWAPLSGLIRKEPVDILGESIAKKFDQRLPFLFKVLAAAKPLSIQAHPNRKQAFEGFRRENDLKIPLDSYHRNYRDKNHKPEILCALTPFWAMTGFRQAEEIVSLLDQINISSLSRVVDKLRSQPDESGLKYLFTEIMGLDRAQRIRTIREAVLNCRKQSHLDPVFEWVVKLHKAYPEDIGILSPILLNLVRLRPREAMYVSAGDLHAYLEGSGIELMANSDNVLRGGLTPKYIDVRELLDVLNFKPGKVDLIRPEKGQSGEGIYTTTTEEFRLSVIDLTEGSFFLSPRRRSVEIMICVEGKARIIDLGIGDSLALGKGTVIMIPSAVDQYRIEGTAFIYKAGVPL